MLDVAIIGCGITGAATAYELSKYKLNIAVFESENDVAMGTTRTNGGIIHAGYDPKPGTLMAKLNVEGARLTGDLCRNLDIPYKRIGSLVIAFSDEELAMIRSLYERGIKNGVSGLQLINGDEVHKLEPFINKNVLGALLAPSAAMLNPWEYALALAETAVRNGVQLYLNCGVSAVRRQNGGWALTTPKGVFIAKTVINAAGLYADAVHEMAGEKEFTIQPNRGQYFVLDKSEGGRLSHVVFQCPSSDGKGVVLNPTTHGVLLVGPNAENVPLEQACLTTAQGLRFVAEKARRIDPCIDLGKSIRNFSGSRAIPDTGDFIIAESKTAKGFINLAGIKSPGLSAAPAIAKMAADLVEKTGFKLERKDLFLNKRKKIRIHELGIDEINALVAQKPAYGRVVCRCETVTEGEILDALQSPVPPCSLDAVKRRCGAGLGRCQGGFCGPRVLEILARELKIPPEEVFMDRNGSFIVLGGNREGDKNA